MTTLLTWASVSSKGPSAVYIATDSRVTWEHTDARWDNCRKTFASLKYPDILGYCGDAVVIPQIITQIVSLIDIDMLFTHEQSADSKFDILTDIIKAAYHPVPKEKVYPLFTIVHCTLDVERNFHINSISWSVDNGWETKKLDIPNMSSRIEIYGSGAKVYENIELEYKATDYPNVSSRIFNCFCESIKSGRDPRSGGPPQLVGIYEQDNRAKTFGIIADGKKYVSGLEFGNNNSNFIEWRNELFERCDSNTLQRLPNATPQPHASKRKKN